MDPNHFDELPTEIVAYVFNFVADEYLAAVALVCHRWNNVILAHVEIDNDSWNHEIRMLAYAKQGHINLLEACWSRQDMTSQMCQEAAGNGQLTTLQWLYKRGCFGNETTCLFAAEGGHLDVLKWARENDCEWDEDTCTHAAEGGHLHVLQWARENGCPWDENTCSYAARGGHFDVLKWARENDCPWD